MQEKIGDPGSNTSLKLVLEGRCIGNQLRGSRGAAGRFEEPDALPRENIGQAGRHAFDPLVVLIVVSKRHSLSVFSSGANRGETVQATELCIGVFSENPPEDSLLFFGNAPRCASEAGEFGNATGQPYRVRECTDHATQVLSTRVPTIRSPARVKFVREIHVRQASSSPCVCRGFILVKKATRGSRRRCPVTSATPCRSGAA
jgi:hypothetical protein